MECHGYLINGATPPFRYTPYSRVQESTSGISGPLLRWPLSLRLLRAYAGQRHRRGLQEGGQGGVELVGWNFERFGHQSHSTPQRLAYVSYSISFECASGWRHCWHGSRVRRWRLLPTLSCSRYRRFAMPYLIGSWGLWSQRDGIEPTLSSKRAYL
jgi:hypothetical protein